jgi:hypothetical protein
VSLKYFYIAVVLSLLSGHIHAQKVETGLGVGLLNYKGDVSPSHKLRVSRPAASLFFRYNVSKSLTFRAEGMAGMITADDKFSKDPYQQQRGESFRSLVFEGDLVAEYNFLNYEARRHAFNWTPYVFGGIGYMGFRPSLQTGSYKKSGVVIPFGVGVKYEFARPWSVGVELGARKTFNDYLDDLGDNAPVGRFSQGDPALMDMYAYLRFSISYTFYRIVCPK